MDIELKRRNLAERMYRITGGGLYRDTELLGLETPFKSTPVRGLVWGQDSIQATLYGERIFWIYGDTSRPGYPLGNFRSSVQRPRRAHR
ncbi:MAG: hypothetical protein QM811_14820 [Pirellulales bacterium]